MRVTGMGASAAAREMCEDARHGEGRHPCERVVDGRGVAADADAGERAGTGRRGAGRDVTGIGPVGGTEHAGSDIADTESVTG